MTAFEKAKASLFSIIRLNVAKEWDASIADISYKVNYEHEFPALGSRQVLSTDYTFIINRGTLSRCEINVHMGIVVQEKSIDCCSFTVNTKTRYASEKVRAEHAFEDRMKNNILNRLRDVCFGEFDEKVVIPWLTNIEMRRRKTMKKSRFELVRFNLFSVVKEAFLTVFGGQINKDSLDVKPNYFRHDEATSAFFDPIIINASWDYITENGDVVRTVSIKICVGNSDINIQNLDITCKFQNIQNFKSQIPWKLYPEYSIKMKSEILSRLSELLEDETSKEIILITPRGNCKTHFKRMLNSIYGMASMSLPEFKYCINDVSILGNVASADFDGDVISKEEIQNIIKGEDTMKFDCMKIIEGTKKIIDNFFNFNRYALKTLSPDFAATFTSVDAKKARAYHYAVASVHKIQIAANYITKTEGYAGTTGVLSIELAYDDDFHLETTVEAGLTIPANVLKKFRETLEYDLCKLKAYGKFTVNEHQPRYPWGKPNEDGLAQALEKIHLLSNANARLIEAYSRKDSSLKVDRVIANYPAVVVFWKDGSKTIVKCGPDDQFDIEKGVAMAFAKKALGNDYAAGGRFKAILKHVQIETKKEPKKKEEKEEEPVIVEAPKNAKPKKADFIKTMVSQGFTKAEAERAWKGMNSKAK